eukprot:IDg5577t1
MGPEGPAVQSSAFTDKVPPSFDGHNNYASYRQDVELWTHLTTLPAEKHGAALIGRLSGEAKAAAKTLSISEITSELGVNKILQHLDKSYAVNKTDQLDLDLASFLDFTWNVHKPVEQFIAGFHTRLDRIAELNINNKLKGHLLLRQAGLDHNARSMIVGAASGSYEVDTIATALRQMYRHIPNISTASMGIFPSSYARNKQPKGQLRSVNNRRTENNNQKSDDSPCIFYTFNTAGSPNSTRAIVDSGACASVVGKDTLDIVMKALGISSLENSKPTIGAHRFGNHREEQSTLFAVKFPMVCQQSGRQEDLVEFQIKFDVIPGHLPFLIGFPALKAMKANLNFKFNTLGMYLHEKYARIPLHSDKNHLYLRFGCKGTSNFSAYSVSPEDSSIDQTPAILSSHYTPDSSSAEHTNCSNTKSAFKQSAYSPGLSTYTANVGEYVSNKNKKCAPGAPVSLKLQEHPSFDPHNLKKLHIQLKHGTKSQMTDWIKSVEEWVPELENCIDQLLMECPCVTAHPPIPHSAVSIRLPNSQKQTDVSVDTVFFEGVPCLHVVCKSTRWSEADALRSNNLRDHVAMFKKIQVYRHGPPLRIHGDNQFVKGDFAAMCDEIGAKFVPSAANDHEANGAIESANRILKNYFRRIRAIDQRSTVSEVLSEAVYGKNICKGKKLASSFELLYNS